MIEERRRYPRIEIEQMVQIVMGKKQTIYAIANDISESGLSFTTQDPIEPNTDLEVLITLETSEDKKEVIKIQGIEIYCCEIEDTYKSGMDFKSISREHRDILKSFIDYTVS